MARIKKIEGETTGQKRERHIFESISGNATRSEKISWNRKMDNMVKLLTTLRPIEEEILALILKKQPILDEVQTLRITMVNECVHPFEYLVLKDGYVECKFCNKKISIPDEYKV
jgi:hypothetical protein